MVKKTYDINREPLIDVAKGIAILLVLLGHTIQFASGEEFEKASLFYNNIVFKTIYSFHMPLFMVISGYLYYNSINNKSFTRIITDKLRQLIVPIFSIALIVWLLQFHTDYTFLDQIRSYLSVTRYTLWFLWALFYSSIGVLLGNKLFKDNIVIWILLILCSFLTPDKWFSEMYKYTFPCFLFGYYFHKHNLIDILKNHLLLTTIGSGTLLLLCLFFYRTNVFVYVSGCNILHEGEIVYQQLWIDIFRIIVGIIGSIWFISTLLLFDSIIHNKGKAARTLSRIGICSMGIYCFQTYLFVFFKALFPNGIFYPIEPTTTNIWDILINRTICFVLIFFLSYTLTELFKRVKPLNVLFLGGR